MAWFLVKHKNNFTFTLNTSVVMTEMRKQHSKSKENKGQKIKKGRQTDRKSKIKEEDRKTTERKRGRQ
jgi:hypothetical protein